MTVARDQAGSVALEAALAVPVALLVLLVGVAATVPAATALRLHGVAHAAARTAVVHGDHAARRLAADAEPAARVVVRRTPTTVEVELVVHRDVLGVPISTRADAVAAREP